MKVSFVIPPFWGSYSPHLGIAYLAGVLKRRGYQFDINDLNVGFKNFLREYWMRISSEYMPGFPNRQFHPFEFQLAVHSMLTAEYLGLMARTEADSEVIGYLDQNLQRMVKNLVDSDAVCFSVYDSTVDFALMLSKKIKEARPEVPIIWGGPSVEIISLVAERMVPHYYSCGGIQQFLQKSGYLQRFKRLIRNVVNVIISGEGELTLLEVLDKLNDGKSVENVAGASFVQKDGGRILQINPPRPLLNIDCLPFPDFEGFRLPRYSRLPFHFSRGCPFDCAFCDEKKFWGRYRARRPENVAGELEHDIETYGADSYVACDSLINANPSLLSKFCDMVVDRKLDIRWWGMARATLMDEQLLGKLSRAGCEEVYYGVESGSRSVLNDMHKGAGVGDYREIVGKTYDSGISCSAGLIIGFPTETMETALKTIDLVEKLSRYLELIELDVFEVGYRSSISFANLDKWGIKMKIKTGKLEREDIESSSYFKPLSPGVYALFQYKMSRKDIDNIFREFCRRIPSLVKKHIPSPIENLFGR